MAESLLAEISEIMRVQGIDQIVDHCMNLFRMTDTDGTGVIRYSDYHHHIQTASGSLVR